MDGWMDVPHCGEGNGPSADVMVSMGMSGWHSHARLPASSYPDALVEGVSHWSGRSTPGRSVPQPKQRWLEMGLER